MATAESWPEDTKQQFGLEIEYPDLHNAETKKILIEHALLSFLLTQSEVERYYDEYVLEGDKDRKFMQEYARKLEDEENAKPRVKECAICNSKTTYVYNYPRWHKSGDGGLLCHTCYCRKNNQERRSAKKAPRHRRKS